MKLDDYLKSDKYKEDELIKNEVYEKLMDFGLEAVLENYLEICGLINIDFDDIINVVHKRKIVNYYNGNVNFNNPIYFNFNEANDSMTLLIIEANSKLTLKRVDEVLIILKEKLKNTSIIYGTYVNERIEDNQARLLIINTIAETYETLLESINIEKELNKDYNLDDIIRQCKENNNYSINFIQSITNLGFCECQKIKDKILNLNL